MLRPGPLFLMIFPYEPHVFDQTGAHFDEVVRYILNRKLAVSKPPDRKVCEECDLRVYCTNERLRTKQRYSQ
jgi:CRISPR/Cas system-associated exonuclease Cas4 (RecB family)